MNTIVIIGNGISGITTARQIRKRSTAPITVISSETEHFFSRTALMYIFMGHMKYEHTKPYEDWFWEKNKITLVFDHVEKIDFQGRSLQMQNGNPIRYEKLVLAVGSKSNMFGWPGQNLIGAQGLYSKQDLDNLEARVQEGVERAVIVGGGLIGVELAEMLHTRNIPVTFLVRESHFWGNVLPKQESELITRHMIDEHHIDLRFNTNMREIVDDGTGKVKGVLVDGSDEMIPCQVVGLTAGVSPNIDFLKDTALETDRGILVNEFLETNIEYVYAVGDCVQFRKAPKGRRNIEQVWYTGRMMAECLAQTITRVRTPYEPGVWFNSAKFFDIEYQTYGWVMSQLRDKETEFYWEHPKGKICMHAVYHSETKALLGVNVFGIRLRHHYMNDLIEKGKTIEDFIAHLKDALFDPEFFKNYAASISKAYQAETGIQVRVKHRSWYRIMKAFKASNQV